MLSSNQDRRTDIRRQRPWECVFGDKRRDVSAVEPDMPSAAGARTGRLSQMEQQQQHQASIPQQTGRNGGRQKRGNGGQAYLVLKKRTARSWKDLQKCSTEGRVEGG